MTYVERVNKVKGLTINGIFFLLIITIYFNISFYRKKQIKYYIVTSQDKITYNVVFF